MGYYYALTLKTDVLIMTVSPPAGTDRPRKIIKKVRKKDVGDRRPDAESELEPASDQEPDVEPAPDSSGNEPSRPKKKKKKKKIKIIDSAADDRAMDDFNDSVEESQSEPDEPAEDDGGSDWDNAFDISAPGGSTLEDVSPDDLRKEAEQAARANDAEPADGQMPSDSAAPESSRRKKKKIIRRKVRKKDLDARRAEIGKQTTIDSDGVIDSRNLDDAEPMDDESAEDSADVAEPDETTGDDWDDGDGAQPVDASEPEPEEEAEEATPAVKDSSRRSKRASVRGSRRSARGSASADDDPGETDEEPVSREDRRAQNRRKARNFIIMSAILVMLAIPTAVGYWVYRHKVKKFVSNEPSLIKYKTFGEKNTLHYLAELLEVPVEDLLECNPDIKDKDKPLGADKDFMIPAKHKDRKSVV